MRALSTAAAPTDRVEGPEGVHAVVTPASCHVADRRGMSFVSPAVTLDELATVLRARTTGDVYLPSDPEFAEQAKTAGLRIVYMTPDEEKALSDRLVDSAQEYLKK